LYLTSAGLLALRSDALTTGTTSTVTPTGSVWHLLELHLVVGTSGRTDIWLDGAPVPQLSFATINLGTANMGVLQIGESANGTWDIRFDDAAIGTGRLGR
jgi:hypothetical protein